MQIQLNMVTIAGLDGCTVDILPVYKYGKVTSAKFDYLKWTSVTKCARDEVPNGESFLDL